jgi:RNA polymerase sigma factor (sigma-70 family)
VGNPVNILPQAHRGASFPPSERQTRKPSALPRPVESLPSATAPDATLSGLQALAQQDLEAEVTWLVARTLRNKPWLRAEREDIYQEAFLAGWKALERFNPALGTSPMAYAMTCAKGKVLDYLRTKAIRRESETSLDALLGESDSTNEVAWLEAKQEGAEALTAAQECRTMLSQALQDLPPLERDVLLARSGCQDPHGRPTPWADLADRHSLSVPALRNMFASLQSRLQVSLAHVR